MIVSNIGKHKVGKRVFVLSIAVFSLLLFAPRAPAQEKQLSNSRRAQQSTTLSSSPARPAASKPEVPVENRPAAVPLAIALNLSRAQRQALRSINESSKAERRSIVQRVQTAQQALERAIYLGDETEVEAGIQEAAAAQAAAIRLRAASELKIRRLLTAEQLSIYRELRRQAQANRSGK